MKSEPMIRLRNKKTGVYITVPRSQYKEEKPETGLSGIADDVSSSLSSLLPAAGEMISSIPGEAKRAGRYAVSTNPVSTLANLGAGGVESIAGLLSSPQILTRYLAEKFPELGKRMEESNKNGGSYKDPTFYEALMNAEKEHGMAAQSPEEASVRNAGGLLFGGKGLSLLSNTLQRAAALAAEQTGRGGDPIHAAVLGLAGDMVGKGVGKGFNRLAKPRNMAQIDDMPDVSQPASATPQAFAPAPIASVGSSFNLPIAPGMNVTLGGLSNIQDIINKLPQALSNTGEMAKAGAAKVPELAGRTAASALESTADLISELPGIGKAATPFVQPTLGSIGAYLKHISVSPEELAKRNLFGDIEPEDLPTMEKMNEAGKRLNLSYLTPSELLDSPFESVKQANVGRTTKGMKQLFRQGKSREASEESAINKLFDLIHTSKLDPIKKQAYEVTMKNTLPPEFITKHQDLPVIKDAMKIVDNNAAFKQMLQREYGVSSDQIPKNTFMYWDMVKRALGDMQYKAAKEKPTEAAEFSRTRRSIVSDMDAIEPQYKIARNIAERQITKEKLQKVFDKKAKNFNNFDSHLKSKKNYEELLEKLDSFPEAKQQLEDIKLFSGKMVPNNPTTRAAAALKRTGMSDARNALEAKKREFDERYGQEHDLAAVDLMTSPDLMKLLKEYLSK